MRIVRTLYPRHQRRIERFLVRVRSAGVPLEFCQGREETPDLELAFGGDGAVHFALERALATNVPLLVVPFGSGNDFAESIGIGNEDQALQAMVGYHAGQSAPDGSRPHLRTIDAVRVTPLHGEDRKPRYYCCIAGVGMDSQANITANAMPAWLRGHGGYILAAMHAIATFPPMTISIEPAANGSNVNFAPTQKENAWFTVFANAPRYGDGIFIAPKAKLDDGLLDIVVVGQMLRRRLLRFFPKVFSGSHLAIPEVRQGSAASFTVTTDPPLPIQGDGEYLCHTPAKFEVMPKALKVVVP